jgi:hypothetical protein
MATVLMDEEESAAVKKWNEEHLAAKHAGREPYAGAIGGRITYIVGYTTIGSILKVRCESCNEETDLTNYDLW